MFRLGFDKRTITIVFIVLVALKVLSSGTAGLLNVLLMVPGVLIALTFHEYAHGFVAYKLGDETPKIQGRLNLNPISHIDWIGFALLITAGFGWGKPVQIDSRNFNGKYSISKSEAMVAVAGPIVNFIIAFVFFIILYLLYFATNAAASMSINVAEILYTVILYTISVNIGLGVFNLIPLPPLDGSKVLAHFLPYNAKQWFYNNQQIFYIVFLLLWVSGLSSVVIEPIFSLVFSGMNWIVEAIFGLFI